MSTMTRTSPRRLLVTRRNPDTRHYEAIGELIHDEYGYTFTYRDGITRALPGMPPGEPHRSAELFPLFSHRVISPRRADHDDYLARLDLPPTATPFEVLTRSGGRSAVDTLEVTSMPEPGPVALPFLVHGIRHLTERERARIDTLAEGQRLHLQAAPDTPTDEDAVLVTDDGHRLGYVPRPLTEYVHPIMAGDHELTVERVNHRDAGFHMRLLVQLVGTYPG